MKICSRCHHENADDAIICVNCGDNMNDDETKVFGNKIVRPQKNRTTFQGKMKVVNGIFSVSFFFVFISIFIVAFFENKYSYIGLTVFGVSLIVEITTYIMLLANNESRRTALKSLPAVIFTNIVAIIVISLLMTV